MGLLFYPRGGSAQVVRYLSRALDGVGWQVSLACGSLGAVGAQSHAGTFFEGLSVDAADYGPALAAHAAGRDPLEVEVPLHPSFEDGGDNPDRVFAAVSPEIGEHLIQAWVRILEDAWPDPKLFHLHHLTPLQAAVQQALAGPTGPDPPSRHRAEDDRPDQPALGAGADARNHPARDGRPGGSSRDAGHRRPLT